MSSEWCLPILYCIAKDTSDYRHREQQKDFFHRARETQSSFFGVPQKLLGQDQRCPSPDAATSDQVPKHPAAEARQKGTIFVDGKCRSGRLNASYVEANYAHMAYKKPKTSTDPDTLGWNRTMSSSFKSQFMNATMAEVEQLTKCQHIRV